MKQGNIYKFLYFISIFLIIGFVVRLGIDYFKYDGFSNSAPFYVFIAERVVEFLLPSIIVFIVAKLIKKKNLK